MIFASFLGVYFFLQKKEQEKIVATVSTAQDLEASRLNDAVSRMEERLVSFANEYSWGEPFTDEAQSKVSNIWAGHVSGRLNSSDVGYVWLFDLNMRARISLDASEKSDTPDPFFVVDLRDALLGSVFGHFYILNGGTLWELAYAPVQPLSDSVRKTAPRGYLVALRRWDSAFLSRLGNSLGAELSVMPEGPPSESYDVPATWDSGVYTAFHKFMSRTGDSMATLRASRTMPFLSQVKRDIQFGSMWMLAGAPVLFLLTLLVGYLFIGLPVRRLSRALRTGNLDILEGGSGEFAVLADAVSFAYTQRSSMQTENIGRGSVKEQLVQRERFLSTILRYINGIVLVVSHDGVLNLAEGRELDAYGLSKDRDEGRPISSILRGQDRLSQFEAALRGKRSSMEQKVGERVFLTMCEPLPGPDGGTDSIVVLALDMTEKRQVEEALLRAKQDAERADRVKTQFLSVMSHETRTPLNGVLGFASVLRETPLNEEQMGYLDRIVESGQNLLRLLTDIVDLARLEAGEGKKNLEPISLTALVYQFAERYRIACQAKGRIDFDLDVDQRMPDFIESDNDMLSRILSSLLDNAVKFTDMGRVKFAVSWIAKDRDGRSGVTFTVSDTGPGIAPEIARSIFNPFSQGDTSHTRRHGGLGLGLTIAHRLTAQLEGRLTFETKIDVGSTFKFFLPAKALDEKTARSAVKD
ncbi:MAG: ATP-binding protein [Opitutales bacterium]